MSDMRAILVTGAGGGIGRAIVKDLSSRGAWIYATARRDEHLEALEELGNVTALRVDVTQPPEIEAGVRAVAGRGLGLHGLVNNAAMGELGMLSMWSDADLQRMFDVNVLGPHRMTNAFLPLLLESRGRIVNIGSRGGMMSKSYYGPYTMTKHALESYTETLRCELASYGVLASIVQPGGVDTGMGEAAMPGTIKRIQGAVPPFDEEAKMLLRAFTEPSPEPTDGPESETNRKPSPPQLVADAVRDALFSEQPKLRYLVCTQWEGERLLETLIDKLLDENDAPSLRLTQEQVTAMVLKRWGNR